MTRILIAVPLAVDLLRLKNLERQRSLPPAPSRICRIDRDVAEGWMLTQQLRGSVNHGLCEAVCGLEAKVICWVKGHLAERLNAFCFYYSSLVRGTQVGEAA